MSRHDEDLALVVAVLLLDLEPVDRERIHDMKLDLDLRPTLELSVKQRNYASRLRHELSPAPWQARSHAPSSKRYGFENMPRPLKPPKRSDP